MVFGFSVFSLFIVFVFSIFIVLLFVSSCSWFFMCSFLLLLLLFLVVLVFCVFLLIFYSLLYVCVCVSFFCAGVHICLFVLYTTISNKNQHILIKHSKQKQSKRGGGRYFNNRGYGLLFIYDLYTCMPDHTFDIMLLSSWSTACAKTL